MNLRRLLASRFLKDSAVLQVSGAAIAASGLLSSAVVAALLGAGAQGQFFTALALYGLVFMLLGTGVVQATVTQLAASIARGQHEKAAAWLAFLIKSYALAGILLPIGGYYLLPWLGELLTNTPNIGFYAWILSFTPLVELPRVLAYTTFQGTRRMADLARLELGTEGARLILVCTGAYVTRDATGPVIGTLIASGFGSLLGILLYRRMSQGVGHKLPGPRQILSQVREVPIRRGLALGLRIGTLRSLDALTVTVLPPLIIFFFGGKLAGTANPDAWVTYFKIAQRIMQIPAVLLGAISRTALPALSGIVGRGDAEGFRRSFLRVTFGAGGVMILVVAVLVLVLPLLVRLVYPEDYVEPVRLMGSILALAYCLQGFAVALDSFYILAQRLRFAILFAAGWALLAVPFGAYLNYRMGPVGSAWGIVFSFSSILVLLGYPLVYFRRGHHRQLLEGRSTELSSESSDARPVPQ